MKFFLIYFILISVFYFEYIIKKIILNFEKKKVDGRIILFQLHFLINQNIYGFSLNIFTCF